MISSQMTALIALDFSKTFDSINHELLVLNLHFIGVGENASQLFISYLKDRAQGIVVHLALTS